MKSYTRVGKVLWLVLVLSLSFLVLTSCGDSGKADSKSAVFEKELSAGEVFENGGYINVEDVKIVYDGKSFTIKNNRSDIVRISCSIVGVKSDGSYEVLGMPSLCGVDEILYEMDKSKNGWAVKNTTNMIRPGETLTVTFNYLEYYQDLDTDGDGFYDVVFTISPQIDEKTITTSSTDPKSEIYKIKI